MSKHICKHCKGTGIIGTNKTTYLDKLCYHCHGFGRLSDTAVSALQELYAGAAATIADLNYKPRTRARQLGQFLCYYSHIAADAMLDCNTLAGIPPEVYYTRPWLDAGLAVDSLLVKILKDK